MKLFIKNIITQDSVKEVKSLLLDFGVHTASSHLGEFTVDGHISVKTYREIDDALRRNDFQLLTDKRSILAEKIQNAIVEMINASHTLPPVKYSGYLSKQLEMNYAYLSRFFSEVKNVTIEKFIIIKKVERVKELLAFSEMAISEIAGTLHYSSTNHLCSQFKRFTGFSPSKFKKTIA